MTDNFRIGIERKVFNFNLRRAMEVKGMNQRQLAEAAGLSPHVLSAYVRFKRYPSLEDASTLASILDVPIDSIFPEELAHVRVTKQPEPISVTLDEFARIAGSYEHDFDNISLKDDMAAAMRMAGLTDRERHILDARFGLTDGQENTLQSIADDYGLTRDRIRQIEAKALRKLRQTSRRSALPSYYPSRYHQSWQADSRLRRWEPPGPLERRYADWEVFSLVTTFRGVLHNLEDDEFVALTATFSPYSRASKGGLARIAAALETTPAEAWAALQRGYERLKEGVATVREDWNDEAFMVEKLQEYFVAEAILEKRRKLDNSSFAAPLPSLAGES